MKKYIGTKIIEAKKAEKDGRKGYAVRYKDGYESWSPLEAFEEAYHCIDDGLTFGEAIQLMKKRRENSKKRLERQRNVCGISERISRRHTMQQTDSGGFWI